MKRLLTILLCCAGFSSFAQPCITNSSSLSFNGTSSYVSFSSNNGLDPVNGVTVEAWINATSWAFNVFDGTIFCKHSWSSGEQGFVLRAGNNGQLSFNIACVDTTGIPTSWVETVGPTSSMVLNTWYHVAGSYDGDSIRLYINGIRVATNYQPGTMVQASAFPPAIGKLSDPNQFGVQRYWTGKIDEVRVWDRALSDSELLARYPNHIDPAGQTGLIGYWRLNENTGTSTVDLSTSGNNGTLSGATWSTVVPFTNSATTPFIIPNGIVLTSTAAAGYQWNLNGVPVLNATNQVYTAAQNGNYTVTVTDSLGCSATSGVYIVTGVGVGIEEIGNDSHYQIQRSSGQVNIISSTGIIDHVLINDLTGRYVTQESGNGSNTIALNIGTLQKGIYLLIVSDQKNAQSTIRIMLE